MLPYLVLGNYFNRLSWVIILSVCFSITLLVLQRSDLPDRFACKYRLLKPDLANTSIYRLTLLTSNNFFIFLWVKLDLCIPLLNSMKIFIQLSFWNIDRYFVRNGLIVSSLDFRRLGLLSETNASYAKPKDWWS